MNVRELLDERLGGKTPKPPTGTSAAAAHAAQHINESLMEDVVTALRTAGRSLSIAELKTVPSLKDLAAPALESILQTLQLQGRISFSGDHIRLAESRRIPSAREAARALLEGAEATVREQGTMTFEPLEADIEEGIAHPENDYEPFGVVVMDEPEPKKAAHTKADSPSATKLEPSVIKPLRLFPKRKRTATPPDDAAVGSP
ncbi:MAG: hypothetical protein ABSD58_08055 [Verrucomicrobiia bacterium]|jgi:hypothetical protein